MNKNYGFHLALSLLLASTIAACGGGGGGGTPPPPSNEGSLASPVNLGPASTTITHGGSISADGVSYYLFTTGSTTSYTISLTNTHSDLEWAVLSNPDYTSGLVLDCDNYMTPGANNEICSVTLTAGTTYYLGVAEWDTVAGTYTLAIDPSGSSTIPTPPPAGNEGSIASPLSLGTVSTSLTHTGSVSAFGTSFYTFTTGSTSGTYTIGLTNTHSDLSWGFATDSTFTAPAFICDNHITSGANNEICQYPLTAGTTYYLAVDEWDTVAGTYTLSIAAP